MELRDKLVKTIEYAIKSDVVGLTLTEMDISGVAYRVADVLIEKKLVVDNVQKEIDVQSTKRLREFAVKYYPCFNREQQREIANRCGWSLEKLEQEFYKPYVEKHGCMPKIK